MHPWSQSVTWFCRLAMLLGLGVRSDHGHWPGVSLGDHIGHCRRIFLEMSGLAVGLQGGLVVVDFIEEEVVRIAGEVEDIEPGATRLLHRRGTVLRDGCQKLLALGRHDIEIYGVDE